MRFIGRGYKVRASLEVNGIRAIMVFDNLVPCNISPCDINSLIEWMQGSTIRKIVEGCCYCPEVHLESRKVVFSENGHVSVDPSFKIEEVVFIKQN